MLIQKTSFPYEILIHDDASTDGTEQIIRHYERQYPTIVKPLYEDENQWLQGRRGSATFNIPRARGKYIAFCEGDDYWTDPHKLQKQVNILESKDEYGLVHTDCDILYDNSGKIIRNINKHKGYDYSEYANPFYGILIGEYVIRTLTVVFRRRLMDQQYIRACKDNKHIRLDLPLWLELANRTRFYYVDDSTAVYRKRRGSLTHQVDRIRQLKSQIDSKTIRVHLAEKYEVPKDIRSIVNNEYYRVLLRMAYHTGNKELANRAYTSLKGNTNIYEKMIYYSIIIGIITPLSEILRRSRKGVMNIYKYLIGEKVE
jgi:glycosyltransferase involved in cell wall biosynthesis